jgi:hypothetical protein
MLALNAIILIIYLLQVNPPEQGIYVLVDIRRADFVSQCIEALLLGTRHTKRTLELLN